MKSRSLIFLLTLVNLFNYIDRYVIASVAPRIQQDFGLSQFELGLLMSAFMIGYMIFSPFFGLLGDTKPRPKLMGFGVFLWSLATVLSGWMGSFISFFLVRVGVGIGEASFSTLAPCYLKDRLNDREKINRALGIFYFAIPIGGALGFIWGGIAVKNLTWQSAFLIAGIASLPLSYFISRLKETERSVESGQPFSFAAIKKNTAGLFTNREYLFTVLGYTAYMFSFGGYASWGSYFGSEVLGKDLAGVNHWIGIVTVAAGVLGTLLGGRFGDIFAKQETNPTDTSRGYRRFCSVVTLLALPFSLCLPFVSSLEAFLVLLFLMQTLLFACSAPVAASILEAAPKHLSALAMALSIFASHALGDLISPSLVGLISDLSNLRAGFLLLSLVLLLSSALWLFGTNVGKKKPASP